MLSEMSLGQKIKEIRRLQGVSQGKLARDIGSTQSRISRIETGSEECDAVLLRAIISALGLEGAPLVGKDDIIYRNRLYTWYGLISNLAKLPDAEKMKGELCAITKLPFEKDLLMFYRSLEAMLFCLQGDKASKQDKNLAVEYMESAEQSFTLAQAQLEQVSDESRFYYYFARGIQGRVKRDLKGALNYFKSAEAFKDIKTEKNLPLRSLHYNIATLYYHFGLVFQCISALEYAAGTMSQDNSSYYSMMVRDSILAICYMHTGVFVKAQKLMESGLTNAKSENQKYLIGIALHNLGHLHIKTKQHEKALEYFDEAAEYWEGRDKETIENLYLKGICLIQMKSPEAEGYLRETSVFVKSKNVEHYNILFESLTRLLTVKSNESIEYLTNTTIPHLTKMYRYFEAIDYCNIIENQLRSKNNRKANKIAKTARDIYEKIISGDID